MRLIIATYILTWAACGLLAYGLCFGFFQERFKCVAWPQRMSDRALATLVGLAGPIGLIVTLLSIALDSGPWVFRLRGITAEESWRDHHERWPRLSLEDWLGS